MGKCMCNALIEHAKYCCSSSSSFCICMGMQGGLKAAQMYRYNQSADIWSFGMVLMELARGKVPLCNCSFTKIILETVHGPAPCLESSSDNKFSKVC